MWARQRTTLLKGDLLGSGGYGNVYSATERETGRVVALKQSRVSLRVERPMLQHEARVLKVLSGHSTIPEVFAYGRIQHFELLSMQLLHRSLADVVEESGPLPLVIVLDITDQLLDSLDHIHRCGIVHRDIRPDNILLKAQGAWQLRLVDFGLAHRPKAPSDNQKGPRGSQEPVSIFGTLPYASLNAHQGLDLTFRDDLESLAYTLIFLLRGNLPWSRYTRHGSVLGRLRQVYGQKKSYGGQRLASGLPVEFGALVDYARSMPVAPVPDYAEWRRRFRQYLAHEPVNRVDAEHTESPEEVHSPPPPPAEIGQLVIARLMSAVSIEGYSAQAGHEESYIHDTSLASDEWSTLPRPGVVIDVRWDDLEHLYRFTIVTIGQRQEGTEMLDLPNVPILGPGPVDPNTQDTMLSVEPDWPLDHSYCYAFKNPATFYCLPSQAPISHVWKIDAAGVAFLDNKLRLRHNPLRYYSELNSRNPDIRHDVRMRRGFVKLYADISPLTPEHVNDTSEIDWSSNRAWFDERVKVSRRRDLDDGVWRTGALFGPGYERAGDKVAISNSYREDDFEDWNAQQERNKSLTLSAEPGEQIDVAAALGEIILM